MDKLQVDLHRRYFLNIFVTELEGNRRKAKNRKGANKEPREPRGGDQEIADGTVEAITEDLDLWYQGRSNDAVLLNGIYWVVSGITLLAQTSLESANQINEGSKSRCPPCEQGGIQLASADHTCGGPHDDVSMADNSKPGVCRCSPDRTHDDNNNGTHDGDGSALTDRGFRPSRMYRVAKEITSPYQDGLIQLIQSCYDNDTGGFKPHPDYLDSLVSTMSAVQSLLLLNQPQLIQRRKVTEYVCSLQDPVSGSFFPSRSSRWTCEVDLRFALCALVILYHLGYNLDMSTSSSCETSSNNKDNNSDDHHTSHTTNQQVYHTNNNQHPGPCTPPTNNRESPPLVNLQSLISAVLSCQNVDGGFGSSEGNESHSGYTYCAIACLALLNQLDRLRDNQRLDRLCRFLKSRLVMFNDSIRGVGLNGRCGKSPDVCYSWWTGVTMHIVDQHFKTTHLLSNGGDQPIHEKERECKLEPLASTHTTTTTLSESGLREKLAMWILQCQNIETGGFSRTPSSYSGDQDRHQFDPLLLRQEGAGHSTTPDPFHTFFSLASLSILTSSKSTNGSVCSGNTHHQHLVGSVDPLTAFPSPFTTA